LGVAWMPHAGRRVLRSHQLTRPPAAHGARTQGQSPPADDQHHAHARLRVAAAREPRRRP
jgi:hypothetical protein